MDLIEISTEYITLDQFIKYANVVSSGGEAKILIKEGNVRVNDEIETRRGRKLRPGDKVSIETVGSWQITGSGG